MCYTSEKTFKNERGARLSSFNYVDSCLNGETNQFFRLMRKLQTITWVMIPMTMKERGIINVGHLIDQVFTEYVPEDWKLQFYVLELFKEKKTLA